uniref:Uncharacterized protein n=1 Tax=Rhizophora mucronata TaxID=61149 RepID=A0A2P2K1M2_RHIMU
MKHSRPISSRHSLAPIYPCAIKELPICPRRFYGLLETNYNKQSIVSNADEECNNST